MTNGDQQRYTARRLARVVVVIGLTVILLGCVFVTVLIGEFGAAWLAGLMLCIDVSAVFLIFAHVRDRFSWPATAGLIGVAVVGIITTVQTASTRWRALVWLGDLVLVASAGLQLGWLRRSLGQRRST